MTKPIIGITTAYTTQRPAYLAAFAYADAVALAGGIPLFLPYRAPLEDIPQLVSTLHGVVFSGGADLDPAAWGEARHPQAEPIEPQRETYERELIAELDRRGKPTLGICLGAQLMNVHRGGSLTQFVPDVPGTLEHRRLHEQDSRHDVRVDPRSLLARILGATELPANSAHQQAFARIGRGLTVSAWAPDGVPEALEDAARPFWIGVQWHPERVIGEAHQVNLFRHLVQVATPWPAQRRSLTHAKPATALRGRVPASSSRS